MKKDHTDELKKIEQKITQGIAEGKEALGSLDQSARVGLLSMKGKPWSQQENEPLMWYERFIIYYLPLEMGNRGVAQAAKLCTKSQYVSPTWYAARDKYDWERRAAAYDKARLTHRREMIDTVDLAVEDEIKKALLVALRAAVDKVVETDTAEIDIKTALATIPRIAKELQDVYGVGSKAGARQNIEALMAAFPRDLTQKILLVVERRQQAALPGSEKVMDSGDIVDGTFETIQE